MSAPARTARPSRRGLAELLLLTGFLALAAAGAVALFGDELRQAFGARTSTPTAPAAAPPGRPGPAAPGR